MSHTVATRKKEKNNKTRNMIPWYDLSSGFGSNNKNKTVLLKGGLKPKDETTYELSGMNMMTL